MWNSYSTDCFHQVILHKCQHGLSKEISNAEAKAQTFGQNLTKSDTFIHPFPLPTQKKKKGYGLLQIWVYQSYKTTNIYQNKMIYPSQN